MTTYTSHEWLIFVNTVVDSGGAGVVVTAACHAAENIDRPLADRRQESDRPDRGMQRRG
jgi:hypothetical protein